MHKKNEFDRRGPERLKKTRKGPVPEWHKWGPYVSERSVGDGKRSITASTETPGVIFPLISLIKKPIAGEKMASQDGATATKS